MQVGPVILSTTMNEDEYTSQNWQPDNEPASPLPQSHAHQQPVQAQQQPQNPLTQPMSTPQPPQTPVAPSVQTRSAPAPSKKRKEKKEGGILSFISTLLVAFILVQIINLFFFQSYKVFGSSMVPTLHDGDRLIISKVGKTTSRIKQQDYQPKRGDVIVFVDPQRDDLQLIKRVIGLPGERVVILDGKLTVYNSENPNGFNPDDAPYGEDLPKSSGENDVIVPENHIFVSGDNRAGNNSLDSRNELGTVPEENIIGTLKVRVWPFDDARFF